MRYTGFDARKFLVLGNIALDKKLSYLEIGVGVGDIIDEMNGKVKEYYGVDISNEAIEYLKGIYKNANSLRFMCLDVCADSRSLDKKFDFIFSADTLEHVSSASGFFQFIKNHLKPDGRCVIVFPNESLKKHHGILWFENKQRLSDIVYSEGLNIDSLVEARASLWHSFIKTAFWNFPKRIILKKGNNPQTFEKTDAFKIASASDFKTQVLILYLKVILLIVKVFKLYNYLEVGDSIKNKNLLIKISNAK